MNRTQDIDSESMQTYRSQGESMGGGGEGDDLTPGKITVSAGVLLGFSLTN